MGRGQAGGGTLTLSGTNSFTGGTTVSAGRLQLGVGGSLASTGALAVTGGTFDLNGQTQTVGQLSGTGDGTVELGAGTLTAGNAADATLASTITGTGGLTKQGTGALVLSGTNTFTGGTTVSAGTLQIGAGGTTGSVAGNIANNAALSFNRSDALTYGGAITGTGGLTKQGTGLLNLTGTNTFTGGTVVNAGTLSVNGSTATSSTTVNTGGTLGGTGTLGTTTIAGGTLAPGNSIGTVTVNGNLAFGAGSTYAVEVSPSVADRTNVTGTTTIASASTLRATFAPGTYYTRNYTVLSSAGGRTGSFGTFSTVGLPQGFTSSLNYTATDVELILTAILGNSGTLGSGLALSGNQAGVANAINTGFNGGQSLSAGMQGLFSLSGTTLATALNSLTGEAQTGAQTAVLGYGGQFLNTVLGSAGGGGLGGQAVQYASLLANEAADEPRRLRGWMAGFGGWGGLDGTSGTSSVQTTMQGVAVGGDWSFDHGTLGVAVSGGNSSWFLGNGLGSGRGDAFQAGLYGRTMAGPLYVAAAGAWGQHMLSTNRAVPFLADYMSAAYTATSWSGRVETGHRFSPDGTGEWGLTPFVAGQGQVLQTPGFCETSQLGSGAALCFASGSASQMRSELGVEADARLGTVLGSKARLQGRVAWAHEWQTASAATAWFAALPGTAFAVSGAPLPPDIAVVRLLSEVELDRTWSLRLQGDAELAGNYAALAGTLRIAGKW